MQQKEQRDVVHADKKAGDGGRFYLEPGSQTRQEWGAGRERGGWQDLMRNGARRMQQDGGGDGDGDDDDGGGEGCVHACFAIVFMSEHVMATAWSASLLIDGASGIGGACSSRSISSSISSSSSSSVTLRSSSVSAVMAATTPNSAHTSAAMTPAAANDASGLSSAASTSRSCEGVTKILWGRVRGCYKNSVGERGVANRDGDAFLSSDEQGIK